MEERQNISRWAWEATQNWVIGYKFWPYIISFSFLLGCTLLTTLLTPINATRSVNGLYGLVGGIIAIAIFGLVVYLLHYLLILSGLKRDAKVSLTKIEQYISTGKPIPESDVRQLGKSVNLKVFPIRITHQQTLSMSACIVWQGQSNAIYTILVGNLIVKVNFAIAGHAATPNQAKIGLEVFSVTAVGYAKENCIFKVFCNETELGFVSIIRRYRTFECQDRNAHADIDGPIDESQAILCKVIDDKVIWKEVLRIPLNLNVGEEREINFNPK